MRRDAPASFPLATGLLALACLAAGLVELAPQFAYDRAGILAGEIWRLWTGHLVHFSAQQLVVDVSALLLAGWLVERERGTGFTAGVVLLGMPAISIALLLASPQLHEYRGASGVVVLLALVATTSMWLRHPGTRIEQHAKFREKPLRQCVVLFQRGDQLIVADGDVEIPGAGHL